MFIEPNASNNFESSVGAKHRPQLLIDKSRTFRSLVTSPKSPYFWGSGKLLLAQTPVPDRLPNSYGANAFGCGFAAAAKRKPLRPLRFIFSLSSPDTR